MRIRMEMSDSPPSASSTPVAQSAWDAIHSSIPVSYQVAIALDAFILFITFAVLLLLAFYIRNQIKLRSQLSEDGDLEMKGGASCTASNGSENANFPGNTGTKRSMLGKLTRKKGHVRWTSSVEQCSDGAEKGERERVKMKLGSGEWVTDTWGPRSAKKIVDGGGLQVGMRGGNAKSGLRFNPLERNKPGADAGGIGEWQRGSLWKSVEARREKKEKATRCQERAAAGYDGYRGN